MLLWRCHKWSLGISALDINSHWVYDGEVVVINAQDLLGTKDAKKQQKDIKKQQKDIKKQQKDIRK